MRCLQTWRLPGAEERRPNHVSQNKSGCPAGAVLFGGFADGMDFSDSVFDEKKLIAAEFIERIELDGNHVNIIWKA